MDTLVNLIDQNTKCKVSTVLNSNTSEFGKQNMFDNRTDTSWYSDQAKFQYIFLFFESPIKVSQIDITCSGGFCPKVIFI